MAKPWIDEPTYFGPCRRCGDKLRWIERRKHDNASEPPSIGAALRRLRVQVTCLDTEERRLSFLTHVHGAAKLADDLHFHGCSAKLRDLARYASGYGAMPRLEEHLENKLVEAIETAAAESLFSQATLHRTHST